MSARLPASRSHMPTAAAIAARASTQSAASSAWHQGAGREGGARGGGVGGRKLRGDELVPACGNVTVWVTKNCAASIEVQCKGIPSYSPPVAAFQCRCAAIYAPLSPMPTPMLRPLPAPQLHGAPPQPLHPAVRLQRLLAPGQRRGGTVTCLRGQPGAVQGRRSFGAPVPRTDVDHMQVSVALGLKGFPEATPSSITVSFFQGMAWPGWSLTSAVTLRGTGGRGEQLLR